MQIFGAALRENSPEHCGFQYVAAWETRKLRVVPNTVRVFAAHPSCHVLNVVRATHTYFDAYLNMMHDVQVFDAEEVLK